MCTDNYRQTLAAVLYKFDYRKRDAVMSSFEQRLEVESDNGELAACDALYDAGLTYLIPMLNNRVKTIRK